MSFIFGLTESFGNSFCFGIETNLSMMYLRSKDSNSIIWTLSLERIIKNSILVPILRTRIILEYTNRLYSLSFDESSNYLFELKIRSNENVESYRRPYMYIYIYFIVSFPSVFILFKKHLN